MGTLVEEIVDDEAGADEVVVATEGRTGLEVVEGVVDGLVLCHATVLVWLASCAFNANTLLDLLLLKVLLLLLLLVMLLLLLLLLFLMTLWDI